MTDQQLNTKETSGALEVSFKQRNQRKEQDYPGIKKRKMKLQES